MPSVSEKIYQLANHSQTRKWVGAILPYRLWIIIFVHLALFTLSYGTSFLMLYALLETDPLTLFTNTIGLLLFVRFIVFAYYDLYRNLWAFVSLADLVNIMRATAVSSLLFSIVGIFDESVRVPQRMA
jgi:FlaA1/EpsC-like NDP-sugar epimerase